MQLIIDGKPAVLKRGSSFEYISENRSFSDSDDFTLSIALPLAGCPENLAIFGHIERLDADSRKITLKAQIIDSNFSRIGVITVVECSPSEVKVQFLEGRSVQNFNEDLDDVYINDLSIGTGVGYVQSGYPGSLHLKTIDEGAKWVALPWVSDNDGTIHNERVMDNGELKWAGPAFEDSLKPSVSFQPYLITLAKRICEQIYFSYDFTEWESHPDRFLVVCNALPPQWGITEYGRALPHWSVTEFFEELEKILVAEFDIDNVARKVTIRFCQNIKPADSMVLIDNLVDEFSAETSYDDALAQFKGIANVKYQDRDDDQWRRDSCGWLVDLLKADNEYYREFETCEDFNAFLLDGACPLITGQKESRTHDMGTLCYVREIDGYFIGEVRYGEEPSMPNAYRMHWVAVNSFSPREYDAESGNDIELAIVPAKLEHYDEQHGLMLSLSHADYGEDATEDGDGIVQPYAASMLLKGEDADAPEYYSTLSLAYWDGNSANPSSQPPAPIVYGFYPTNLILWQIMAQSLRKLPYSFSLKQRYASYLGGVEIDPTQKMKVSWLSNEMPPVRSVFLIRGKRYLCEKITATFTEDGMSQLLKGEFYPLVD